jgi:hypothetical protein
MPSPLWEYPNEAMTAWGGKLTFEPSRCRSEDGPRLNRKHDIGELRPVACT